MHLVITQKGLLVLANRDQIFKRARAGPIPPTNVQTQVDVGSTKSKISTPINNRGCLNLTPILRTSNIVNEPMFTFCTSVGLFTQRQIIKLNFL